MLLLRKNLKELILTQSSKGKGTSGTLSEANPAKRPFCLPLLLWSGWEWYRKVAHCHGRGNGRTSSGPNSMCTLPRLPPSTNSALAWKNGSPAPQHPQMQAPAIGLTCAPTRVGKSGQGPKPELAAAVRSR